MPDSLVVCIGKGGAKDVAEAISRRTNAPLCDQPGDALTILVDKNGVSLQGYGLTFRGDFEETMLHRITNGRLEHEMLVHVTRTKTPSPKAIDATAGMGEDSILLAAAGYDVTLFEQNPVIAALLKDAIRRGKKNPALRPVLERMHLIEGNSIEHMNRMQDSPELIFLDPMFPSRQKSGLINKKLQLIQKLEHPCVEEEALLSAAMHLHPSKIVIKRPLKGANLAGVTPGYSVKGKAIRYDIIQNI